MAQQAMRVRRAKAERQVDATAAHGLPADLHIAVVDAQALGESLRSCFVDRTVSTALSLFIPGAAPVYLNTCLQYKHGDVVAPVKRTTQR